MVVMGLQLKDEDFCQLKNRMETLEEQNAYVLKVVRWIVGQKGGLFEHLTDMDGRLGGFLEHPHNRRIP